jgi:hypothetical protein
VFVLDKHVDSFPNFNVLIASWILVVGVFLIAASYTVSILSVAHALSIIGVQRAYSKSLRILDNGSEFPHS